MKTPAFYETKNPAIYSSRENLNESIFEEYRKTKQFKNVLEVNIRAYGEETPWTEKHDYIITAYFIKFDGGKPTLEEIDFLIATWNRAYPGVYNYERIKEVPLDFVI